MTDEPEDEEEVELTEEEALEVLARDAVVVMKVSDWVNVTYGLEWIITHATDATDAEYIENLSAALVTIQTAVAADAFPPTVADVEGED